MFGRRFRLPALVRRERGVSYSLSLVMVAPIYLLFVLAVFEVGFLLLSRIGVGYAAHAAARSAVVWDWADASGQHPRLAAWSALAPFAGAGPNELAAAGPVPEEARAAAPEYSALFSGRSSGSIPADGARQRKFQNAAARTVVTVERAELAGPRNLRVTVTYRAPLRVPGISRFLNPNGSRPFEYPVSATAVLPAARPETADGTLGIPFPILNPGSGVAP